jgi:DNA-binding FrmR family transcriptional regulator
MDEEKKNQQKPCCCCAEKTKKRTPEEATALVNRLSRIEGQIRGLKGMIQRDAYCTDILTQSSAVTAALNAFNRELLATHIRTCVAEDIRAGKDEVIDDLVTTLQKLMR